MVLTAYFVLSPAIGLVVTVISRMASRNLTPASRRQDHTTSPSALALFVNSAACIHRIPSRVRDDREAPLEWDETVMDIAVIWVSREAQYFCKYGSPVVCPM